jgi:hypothetical protein
MRHVERTPEQVFSDDSAYPATNCSGNGNLVAPRQAASADPLGCRLH